MKEIRDKAEAVRTYAERAGLGLERQNAAAEVRLRAERRAGEMLAKMALHGGDRRGTDAGDRPTLGDLGVSKDQSARWQKLARVSAGDFDAHVAAVKDRGEELTTAGLLRLAKPARKRAVKAEPANKDAPDAGVVETLAELTDSGVKFGCLYVDPPWPDYDPADDAPTVGELSALPVGVLAAETAQLHLLGAGPAPVRRPGDAARLGLRVRRHVRLVPPERRARAPLAAGPRPAAVGLPRGRAGERPQRRQLADGGQAPRRRQAGEGAEAAGNRRPGAAGGVGSRSARRRAGPAAGWPNAG